MKAARKVSLTTLACVWLLPWWASSAHSPGTERAFVQLKALYECGKGLPHQAGANSTSGCGWRFDGWLCWPSTPPGATAWLPCPDLIPDEANFSGVDLSTMSLNVMHGPLEEPAGPSSLGPFRWQDFRLELLNKIAEDIGDDAPWEESMQSGEDGIREDKINRFKDCLENVLLKQPPNADSNEFMCPKTWDGWSCWNDTLPGSTAYAPCPQFVAGFVSYRQAHKVCTPNGTWFRHPITGNVWSNYTACVDTHDLQYRNLVNSLYVAGYAVSLVALISSLFIFINFRSLRCKRITIHKNLFASFVITNLCWILWYLQVVAGPHVIEKNPLWCQALHVVTQYFLLCNYLWMFCEGLYLHTLLVLAFIAEDKILKWFLLIGWGFPMLPTVSYAVVRGLDPDASVMCWVEHDIWYTYILSIPVCLSILLSFAFLVNIVRVLVTKLRAVDSPDSENIRKAARATLILLPLLGLHYVVTPFRPERDRIFLVYEVFSALVTSLQTFDGKCV
ncbi:calcitonin gene-related peptide type 1 receptor-like [Amblyomma americanum]